MLGLGWLYFRGGLNRIWMFVLFMIVLRFVFNFTILPVRNHDILTRMDFKEVVEEITKEADGEMVKLYSPATKDVLKPAFFGVHFPEKEYEFIEWPPFQLSFYYAAKNEVVLSTAEKQVGSQLFLSDLNLLEDESVDIINTYPIQGKSKTYALFRFVEVE